LAIFPHHDTDVSKEKSNLAAQEGIRTENKQKVTVKTVNFETD